MAEAAASGRRRCDVAIVGYGPTGAALANLLGQAGLDVMVFEREAGVYPLPRAIHFDGEVMRVFHSMGLAEEVGAVSRPGLKGMHFVNAAGETMLVRGGTTARGMHGVASNYYFHQPELEAVLRSAAGRFPNVEVHLRHEVTSIHDTAQGALLRVRNTDNDRTHEVEAAYVVGCDGARSLVRRAMGSPMTDLGLHQAWLVFDVILKRKVDLPEYTVQHCDPARPMTACYVTATRRRWEIMLLPGEDPAVISRPENVWPLVSRWVTPADADLERAAVYTFHSVIAEGWRRGRLLLAGDSAHQTPPFLGQGMCAGIRDVANLAWKLVMVTRGLASDALLDSYESERKPHVHAFIDLAVRLGDIIQTTDPRVAAERDRKFRDSEPEIFVYPTPMLGAGVHSGVAPSGSVFGQPLLGDGRPLDTATGLNFAVIGERALLDSAGEATRALWHELGATVLRDPGGELGEWLRDHNARALILRPDRYVVGIANDAAALESLSVALPRSPLATASPA
jgi:3-(3-hydroxy-phenyl)propionate hydroxylase